MFLGVFRNIDIFHRTTATWEMKYLSDDKFAVEIFNRNNN